MSKGVIYKITVLNFEKHNRNLKKGHKAILISTGFLSDPKIRSLTPASKLLVLSCFFLAGESTSSQFEVSHDSLVFQSGVKSGSLQSQLELLKELQILTFEKNETLINRIEKKRIEKKRIPKGESTQKGASLIPLRQPTAAAPTGTNELIALYCDAWKARYGANPPIVGKTAGQIKSLIKDLGYEKAVIFINAYLEMNDSWFLTKRHDLTTLGENLNSVAQFIQTGRMITRKEVANLDSSLSTANMLDAIERGE